MRDLTVKEKLFVAEYRLDSASFDVLSGMLEMDLQGRLRGQVSKSTESSKVIRILSSSCHVECKTARERLRSFLMDIA